MQPLRPHVQRAPSRLTTTWPISPAAPRPIHGRPSRTMPPPTPVPQNTPSSERYGRPAPSSASASVATWTSLPRATRVPSALDSSSASGKLPSQSGRLRALVTVPCSPSTSPGRADADAVELGRLHAGRLGRLAQRAGHGRRDVGRPAAGRRRHAGLAAHLVVGVDDDRLDLRPAEVDAAAHGASVPAPRAAQLATRRSRSRSALRWARERGSLRRPRRHARRLRRGGRRRLPAPGQALASRSRARPGRGAAHGRDQRRLRPRALRALAGAQRAHRAAGRAPRGAAARRVRAPARGWPSRCAARWGASCWRRSRTARTWRW